MMGFAHVGRSVGLNGDGTADIEGDGSEKDDGSATAAEGANFVEVAVKMAASVAAASGRLDFRGAHLPLGFPSFLSFLFSICFSMNVIRVSMRYATKKIMMMIQYLLPLLPRCSLAHAPCLPLQRLKVWL
jgi:hypothetical protein